MAGGLKQWMTVGALVSAAWVVALPAAQAAEPVRVLCQTTQGDMAIKVNPDWSPLAARRFLQLVDDGFFTRMPLFRCVEGFICQMGAALPHKGLKNYPAFADDPPQPELRHFKRGYLSFAGAGPNTRSTYLFITLGDKVDSLGANPWETPFGVVEAESMQKTVSHFYTGYGDMAPWGKGPDAQKIGTLDGAAYLKRDFPQLDYINTCAVQK
ncbi:peptidylprolyl isomerase [Amantichitinum ursilacus]|uniref:Putative bifunctional phosphatase/peptidyl-prolyl cis-trans isomerase n=1 Tax=Amantichitinum ursilacus TaxID=857265 RepID=A0A0N0GKY6_9NEIS|nr:peptidylprolyl isomerase [Amantichitinum ursilacus]KPC49544.1 putative bifunctional phosphatase/peptidyl-prolyl cis-trans isomerase [Amantichitinum ursilacus]